MNGYEEAQKIEDVFGKLYDKNQMDTKNAMERLRLARTVSTTMKILEEKAKDIIDAETEFIAKEKASQWKQREK